MEEGQVIEHPWVSKALEIAQKRVENYNFEIRKQLLEFDNVMNKQREVIYGLRRTILESESVKDRILNAIEDTVGAIMEQHVFAVKSDETGAGFDAEALRVHLKSRFNLEFSESNEELLQWTPEELREKILAGLQQVYQKKEEAIPVEHLRRLEKILLLNTIDMKWKDHLYAMDQLKDGIGLRSYAQRDPIIEYKREGFAMFGMMYGSINETATEMILKVQPVERLPDRPKGVFESLPQNFVHRDFSTLGSQGQGPLQPPSPVQAAVQSASGPVPVQPEHRSADKVGRNDPCPCGSGKKYKKCCGQ
ncbi:MAG: SEC-C metal-binding domain-containing protein [Candidatus Omnitrophica bacterium]|nr:SEC-C metal-binding domain-containing protein [Candidatus Omnitrophota bacterium]